MVEGHRGCPSLDQRLLLLKVVGSKPLHLASPEQDIPCSDANLSIARQTSSCVITAPTLCNNFLIQTNFIQPTQNAQQARFPRILSQNI